MEKNAIKTILVIPFSVVTCRYSINSSNEFHATTYEKVIEMLTSLAPWSIYSVDHNMSRRLSFFIDLESQTVQEVTVDSEQLIEQNRKEKLEMTQRSLNAFLKESKNKIDNSPKHSILLNAIQNKLWRK